MKKSSLLSSLCIGVMLTGCGTGIKNLDCYRFKTGKNFDNTKFNFEKPSIPHFEGDYDSQVMELTANSDTTINFDSIINKKKVITRAGTYRLTGKSTNTSLKIDTDGVVNLIFDNLNITSIGDTPIEVINAKELNIHVNSKTKNYICDSQTNDSSAAIFASCPINIDGKGFLYLNSYGKSEQDIDSGVCIYTDGDLNIKDTRIIVQLSTGATFEVGGNVNVESAKIDIKFSIGGGIKAKGDLIFNNSLFIFAGAMDGIEVNNLTALNSDFYIYTVGNYIKADTSNIDYNDVYYIKDDQDYYRVDPLHCDNNKVLYKLVYSTKGALVHGETNIVNSNFSLDTDDDSISSVGKISSSNSHYFIKSSNQGIVSDGVIDFSSSGEIDEFPIKIFESYNGLKGEIINFDGASTYIDSSNSGIESFGEEGAITFKNDAKLIVDTDVFGLISKGTIDIDHSFVSVFGGYKSSSPVINEEAKVANTSGTILIAQNKYLPASIEDVDQNTIALNLKKKIKKNDVLHIKSKNRKFFSSLIVPKAYENLMVTLSSNLIANDEYEISKGGIIDYKFVQDMSLLQGVPEEDELLLSFSLDSNEDVVYKELV